MVAWGSLRISPSSASLKSPSLGQSYPEQYPHGQPISPLRFRCAPALDGKTHEVLIEINTWYYVVEKIENTQLPGQTKTSKQAIRVFGGEQREANTKDLSFAGLGKLVPAIAANI
jgi:hypothetical protein